MELTREEKGFALGPEQLLDYAVIKVEPGEPGNQVTIQLSILYLMFRKEISYSLSRNMLTPVY